VRQFCNFLKLRKWHFRGSSVILSFPSAQCSLFENRGENRGEKITEKKEGRRRKERKKGTERSGENMEEEIRKIFWAEDPPECF
jgi:hypothetical protein